MPTIEQGGNSLYPPPAQRVSSVEVLRILLSIGPTEISGAATGALKFLTNMGLFIGQSKAFFDFMADLATAADNAKRGGDNND